MSYRTDNFDLNAEMGQGRPLRPYNKVQWTGVALLAIAMVAYAIQIAADLELIAPPPVHAIPIGLPFLLIGVTLVYSRREGADPAPELAAARKRWLIITVVICVALFGAAALIESLGA